MKWVPGLKSFNLIDFMNLGMVLGRFGGGSGGFGGGLGEVRGRFGGGSGEVGVW